MVYGVGVQDLVYDLASEFSVLCFMLGVSFLAFIVFKFNRWYQSPRGIATMSLPKPEIEKFTIGVDFSLWKMKIRALLIHQGLESALKKDLKTAGSSRSDEKMKHVHNRAHSTLISSLSDSILKEISKEKTALGIWNKIEALCIKKSLAHILFLKKIVYTFSMT